jgi:hypothetical protein
VIGLAVEAGFDTDCNAATAGSVFGMLGGRLKSGVDGFGLVEIEELARRTLKLVDARRVVNGSGGRYTAGPGATQ